MPTKKTVKSRARKAATTAKKTVKATAAKAKGRAASTARRAAAKGKKVLLVEFESVSRVAPLFGTHAIGAGEFDPRAGGGGPMLLAYRPWVRPRFLLVWQTRFGSAAHPLPNPHA